MNLKSLWKWFALTIGWVVLIYLGTGSPLLAGNTTYPVFGYYDGMIRSVGHMGEFFVLAFVLYGVAMSIKIRGWKTFALVLVLCGLIALLDEYHQFFVPGRTFKYIDLLKDLFGALLALAVVKIPIIKSRLFHEKPRYQRIIYYS